MTKKILFCVEYYLICNYTVNLVTIVCTRLANYDFKVVSTWLNANQQEISLTKKVFFTMSMLFFIECGLVQCYVLARRN